jgi:hypothetical protein
MIPKRLVGLTLVGAVVVFGAVSVAAFATGLVTLGHTSAGLVGETSPAPKPVRSSSTSPISFATPSQATAQPTTARPTTAPPATVRASTSASTHPPATPPPAPPPTPPPCGHWLSISLSYATYITVDGVRYGNVVNINPISPGPHPVIVTSPKYDGEYHFIGYTNTPYTVTIPPCGGYIWHA